MFFLEKRRNITKIIKDSAGLSNSSCVMPHYTFEWKQVMVCKIDEPLKKYIDSLPEKERKDYRIISNNS